MTTTYVDPCPVCGRRPNARMRKWLATTPDASLAKSWADSLDDVAEYERSKATPDASALRGVDPIEIGALIDNVERSLRALKDHFAPELAALASGDTEPGAWPTKAEIAAMTPAEVNAFLESRGVDWRVRVVDTEPGGTA